MRVELHSPAVIVIYSHSLGKILQQGEAVAHLGAVWYSQTVDSEQLQSSKC